MKISNIEQRSEEWYRLRAGSIGGIRFGQVISGRKNRLVYDLLDEVLNGYAEMEDLSWNEDVAFGIENEPEARRLYIEQSGIQFDEVGLIQSEQSGIHHASPDGLSDTGIVLEIKCTQSGSIHIQRFFEGPEAAYLPQIQNYFAVSDEVKEVHWISYCPSRTEKPLFVKIFKREQFLNDIYSGRTKVQQIEKQLNELKNQFIF